MFSSVNLFSGRQNTCDRGDRTGGVAGAGVLAPLVLRGAAGSRSHRVRPRLQSARAAMVRVRAGLVVFRNPSSARSRRWRS